MSTVHHHLDGLGGQARRAASRDASDKAADTAPVAVSTTRAANLYEWTDRDEDVTASFEAWAPDAHPHIVGVLRLATTEAASVGQTTCGIYVDVDQARELASLLGRLAAARRS